ncbi:MAG: hypothetical protein JSS82_04135 [Bacteroidetes bacterium]|nr:hypothetical protein [Bacteroidota bacterium]
MQRIPTILKKVMELAEKGDKNTVIDIDLMLDYTRVVYADLLEWRSRKAFVSTLPVHEGVEAKREAAPTTTPLPQTPVPEKKVEVAVPVEEPQVISTPEPPIAPNATPTPEPAKIEATAKPATPVHDIRQSIGINDKYLFMSELFGNNRDEYEKAMDTINAFENYRDAETWFYNNISLINGDDDDNGTLELFRGVLHVFFNTK